MADKNLLLERVKGIRDELKLQSHLFKMESKDKWEELEEKWHDLDPKLQALKKTADKAEAQVEAAVGLVLEELWDGYDSLKKSLRKLKK